MNDEITILLFFDFQKMVITADDGPSFPSLSTTTPSASLIDAASDPECGAVSPKQGTNSPEARRGKK